MQNHKLIFLLISLFVHNGALAKDVAPKWITDTQLSNATHYFVICSADGFDPEEVKQLAESKCLASATKLGGATVTVRQKTVQSLTGSDSSEVAEIQPITKTVDCVWTDRYLEKIQNGVRIWLRCKVDRRDVREIKTETSEVKPSAKPSTFSKFKKAILHLISIPVADRILILSSEGEREAVEVKSNVQQIDLRDGDISVVVRKQKYQDQKIELGEWSNGATINKTVYLVNDL